VRERYVNAWQVTRGHARLTRGPGGWLRLYAARPGVVELRVGL
jgi:hypothetical protein